VTTWSRERIAQKQEVNRVPSPQFFNLPAEKQEEIVRASLREFAERGYDLASTNRIVEEANISKGVLFKYFEDKESLFFYVVNRALQDYVDALPAQDAASYNDPFDWLKDVTVRKIRFNQEHPLTYRLLVRIAKEPQHPVYAKVMDVLNLATQDYLAQVAALLPNEKLRDGLTWGQVFEVIGWISQGLLEKYIAQVPEAVDDHFEEFFQQAHDEMDLYFDIVKHGVYREVDNG
jgi:TetR/AcrR family transcriptional regulator